MNKEKYVRYLYKYFKILKRIVSSKQEPDNLIFVLGYGRSGTSIVIRLLNHFTQIDAHGETSKYFMSNYEIDLERFGQYLKDNKFKHIALKPILNSFKGKDFLSLYPNSKIIWMVRNYEDVIHSALKKFGDRVALSLKEYVLHDEGNGWLAKSLPDREKKIIKEMNTEKFLIEDWMALVWWSVNHYMIAEELYKDEKFLLVRYEDLLSNPEKTLDRILSHCEIKNKSLSKYINNSSPKKAKGLKLNSQVMSMCENLKNKILEVNEGIS